MKKKTEFKPVDINVNTRLGLGNTPPRSSNTDVRLVDQIEVESSFITDSESYRPEDNLFSKCKTFAGIDKITVRA